MSYTPAYNSRINWENEPSTASPINETNLNKMDYALYQHDQALQGQDSRISTLESESKVTSFKGRTGAVVPANDDYTIAQIKATGTAGQVPTLNSQGKLEMQTPDAGGHVIEDNSGTAMPQQGTMQFNGSGVSVTNDATNGKTVVTINGGGGGGSGHTIQNPSGSSMPQRTNLQFEGTGVTVTDNASGNKTVVNINGGSGHTIEDDAGTDLTPRDTMQFKGLRAYDDNTSGSEKTIIDNTPYCIEFDVWNAKTEQEKTALKAQYPKIHIMNVPEATGYIDADLLVKLWENTAPTASFSAQNITLASDDYEVLIICVKDYNAGDNILPTVVVPKGLNAQAQSAGYSNGALIAYRMFNYVSNTSYSVGDAYRNGSVNNALMIPLTIYGIKSTISLKFQAIAHDVKATVDYSTDEHIVGKWIDGSILYEKTVVCGALPNSTTKYVAHNISNLENVVSINGIAKSADASNPSFNVLPIAHPTLSPINIFVTLQNICLETSSNWSSLYPSSYITLRYTKTS